MCNDEARELAQSLNLEIVSSTDTKKDAILSFVNYIEFIKPRFIRFAQKIVKVVSRKNNKFLGVLLIIEKYSITMSFLEDMCA